MNADKKAYGLGIPFINVLEVITHSCLNVSQIPGKIVLSPQVIKNFKVEFGDILFNRTSETQEEVGLASVYLDHDDVVFGGFVIRGRLKKANLDPVFASYLLRSPNIHSQIASRGQGAIRTNIGQQELSKVSVTIPPIEQQKLIARALSDIDALIEGLEGTIGKKRHIKQGAMQELLQPYTNGQLKSGWITETIHNMCVPGGLVRGPFGGTLKKESFVGSGFKVYEQRNAIYRNVEIGRYFINLEKYQELKRFDVKARDFIISCSGTIGKIYQIPEGSPHGVINQALLKLTIDREKYSEDYFCHYFSWEKFQAKIIDNTQGGAMKNLVGMPIFKSTEIPLPQSLEEQTEIATILSDMDTEIATLEAKLTKTRQFKQGMMHELLTGRIRLV